jgi:trimethylamine-N-oxide reductase (cytochrome c)
MTKEEKKAQQFPHPVGKEQTTIKALALSGGYGGAPCSVDYKDGKVIRIRPLHFDEKYDPGEFKLWKIESRGKVF